MRYNQIFNYCILSCYILLFAACKDDEKGAGNQVCFQESGYVAIRFSHLDGDVRHALTLQNRNMETATLQIALYTQEELNAYNLQNKANYSLMPEGTYELSETTVVFGAEESSKEIEFVIHSDKLFDNVRKNTEKKAYALPMKLSNGLTGSSHVIYIMDMIYPELRLGKETTFRLNEQENEFSLSAHTYQADELIANSTDVSVNIAVLEEAAKWLQDYNSTSEVQYSLLPATAYQLGKLTGETESNFCNASLQINRMLTSGGVLEGGNYILPIKLSGEDAHLALERDICVVKVSNPNHLYTTQDCNRSQWKVIFCNSDQNTIFADGAAANILDGNPTSFWASCYNDGEGLGKQEDNFDYTRFAQDGYMQCLGERKLPISIVVDMQKTCYVSDIGLQQRSQTQYAHTKNAKIYLSNDAEFKFTPIRDGGTREGYGTVSENNWQLIATCVMTRSGEITWTAVSDELKDKALSKGRFLKFVALDQLDDDTEKERNVHAGLGEIYAKEVVTVDGKPYTD